jgi:SAM-dependent methyltransferase
LGEEFCSWPCVGQACHDKPMGIDINGLRFLLRAKKRGVHFESTITLGRQSLNCSSEDIGQVLQEFGLDLQASPESMVLEDQSLFSENLWKHLGAARADSLDHSSYEGATKVHDMNLPIPQEWHGQYTVVLDGGTLEHVFDFACAVKNAMSLLREGGHYLAITPANNFCGHGFYQFSPELYYSLLSPANGFLVKEIIIFENRKKACWFSVEDPQKLGSRVQFSSRYPVYMLVLAEKIQSVQNLKVFQSDYEALWKSAQRGLSRRRKKSFWSRIKKVALRVERFFRFFGKERDLFFASRGLTPMDWRSL